MSNRFDPFTDDELHVILVALGKQIPNWSDNGIWGSVRTAEALQAEIKQLGVTELTMKRKQPTTDNTNIIPFKDRT